MEFLLHLMLLASFFTTICSSRFSSFRDDVISAFSEIKMLRELLEGPVLGNSVLVVDDLAKDSKISRNLNWNEIVNPVTRMMYTSSKELDFSNFTSDLISGLHFTTLWLIDSEEFGLNSAIGNPIVWCPRYLIIVNFNKTIPQQKILEQRISLSSEYVVLLKKSKGKDSANMFSVFVSVPFPDNEITALGHWQEYRFETKDELFPDRFRNFGGTVLKVASFCDDYPLLYRTPEGNSCIGSNLDTLTLVGSSLNFTFVYQMEPPDHNWGAKENGTWTGMLADLIYNGKHIIINYFLVNLDRYNAFDSTYPYRAEGFGFLALLPKPLPRWNSVILPFTSHMWAATFVCTVLVTALFAGCSALVGTGENSKPDNTVSVGFAILATLLHQPLERATMGVQTCLWGRLWLIVWGIACIILTTAYTGNLIAYLTVPLYPVRIETVKQLAASHLRVTMQDYGEFLPFAMRASSDKDFSTIGHKMDMFPYGNGYDNGIDKVVKNKTHVLVETYSYLMSLQKQYNLTDETYLMKQQVYSGHLAWFLPKNTPYTGRISATLTRLKETGIVQKLYDDHFYRTTKKKTKETGPSVSSVSLDQLQGAFLLMPLGSGLALVVLLLEVATAWAFSNYRPTKVQ